MLNELTRVKYHNSSIISHYFISSSWNSRVILGKHLCYHSFPRRAAILLSLLVLLFILHSVTLREATMAETFHPSPLLKFHFAPLFHLIALSKYQNLPTDDFITDVFTRRNQSKKMREKKNILLHAINCPTLSVAPPNKPTKETFYLQSALKLTNIWYNMKSNANQVIQKL